MRGLERSTGEGRGRGMTAACTAASLVKFRSPTPTGSKLVRGAALN
jgi:hypothetical protein